MFLGQEAVDRSSPWAIEARGLGVSYGGESAVEALDLGVARNAVTAIIGPSGCGKSTALRCFNRMNDLLPGARVTGSVLLEGLDVYAPETDPVELRRRVGMVFQRPNPFPKTVRENILWAARMNRIPGAEDEIVERSLRSAALWDEVKDRLDSSALRLSGGQQQRLCIARALAVRPEVLLMDEPTSALDPISTAKIEELLLELKRDYSIAIVTHNMQQAGRASDRTAFMLKGRLVEAGPTKDIFFSPKRKETEDYLSGRFG